jgi:hypothetical protein
MSFLLAWLKLSQLEDVDFPEHHAATATPDSDSDSDHDSGTDSDSELLTLDDLPAHCVLVPCYDNCA